jgi:hypothetical protein
MTVMQQILTCIYFPINITRHISNFMSLHILMEVEISYSCLLMVTWMHISYDSYITKFYAFFLMNMYSNQCTYIIYQSSKNNFTLSYH